MHSQSLSSCTSNALLKTKSRSFDDVLFLLFRIEPKKATYADGTVQQWELHHQAASSQSRRASARELGKSDKHDRSNTAARVCSVHEFVKSVCGIYSQRPTALG